MDDDESEWLERARRDPALFKPIHDKYFKAVHRLIQAFVCDFALAMDLADNVFLKAMTNLWGYRADELPLRIWLYRIALTEARQHCTGPGNQRRQEPGDDGPCRGTPVREPELDSKTIDAHRVEMEMARLPFADRALLCLHYWGDLDAAEIALLQNCPRTRVESRLVGAKHRLRQSLARS